MIRKCVGRPRDTCNNHTRVWRVVVPRFATRLSPREERHRRSATTLETVPPRSELGDIESASTGSGKWLREAAENEWTAPVHRAILIGPIRRWKTRAVEDGTYAMHAGSVRL